MSVIIVEQADDGDVSGMWVFSDGAKCFWTEGFSELAVHMGW